MVATGTWTSGGAPASIHCRQGGQLVAETTETFPRRRHLALLNSLPDRRLAGLAGNDLVPRDEAFAVEDIVEPALGLAVAAVAFRTVRLENGPARSVF